MFGITVRSLRRVWFGSCLDNVCGLAVVLSLTILPAPCGAQSARDKAKEDALSRATAFVRSIKEETSLDVKVERIVRNRHLARELISALKRQEQGQQTEADRQLLSAEQALKITYIRSLAHLSIQQRLLNAQLAKLPEQSTERKDLAKKYRQSLLQTKAAVDLAERVYLNTVVEEGTGGRVYQPIPSEQLAAAEEAVASQPADPPQPAVPSVEWTIKHHLGGTETPLVWKVKKDENEQVEIYDITGTPRLQWRGHAWPAPVEVEAGVWKDGIAMSAVDVNQANMQIELNAITGADGKLSLLPQMTRSQGGVNDNLGLNPEKGIRELATQIEVLTQEGLPITTGSLAHIFQLYGFPVVEVPRQMPATEGFIHGDGIDVDGRVAGATVSNGGTHTEIKGAEGSANVIMFDSGPQANANESKDKVTWSIIRFADAAAARAHFSAAASSLPPSQSANGFTATTNVNNDSYEMTMSLNSPLNKATAHGRCAVYRSQFVVSYGFVSPQVGADTSHAAGIMKRSVDLIERRFPEK